MWCAQCQRLITCAVHGLSDQRYRRLFAHLDSNHDGKLSRKELWDGMYALRMPCTRYQMRKLVRDWDSGQKGYLSEVQPRCMLPRFVSVYARG